MGQDFFGEIVREPDPPGIDNERRVGLIRENPLLIPPEPREGINPFTRRSMVIRPRPDAARIIVDGREVGVMSWSEDGSNRISVFGDPQAVVPLAREIASSLGSRFRASSEGMRP